MFNWSEMNHLWKQLIQSFPVIVTFIIVEQVTSCESWGLNYLWKQLIRSFPVIVTFIIVEQITSCEILGFYGEDPGQVLLGCGTVITWCHNIADHEKK